ncbi:MAG: hypothetical protein AAGA84_01540 [Pseudomonadota bacterium]
MSASEPFNRDDQRKRVKRNVWLLFVLAFAVYGGFILAGVLRSQGAG